MGEYKWFKPFSKPARHFIAPHSNVYLPAVNQRNGFISRKDSRVFVELLPNFLSSLNLIDTMLLVKCCFYFPINMWQEMAGFYGENTRIPVNYLLLLFSSLRFHCFFIVFCICSIFHQDKWSSFSRCFCQFIICSL